MESSLNTDNPIVSAREDVFACQLEEMLACGASYADAAVDSFKTSVKDGLKLFLTEAFSTLLGVMTLIVAVAFLMYGSAMGLANVLGGRLWLGFSITGLAVIILKLIQAKRVIYQSKKNSERKHHQRTIAKSSFIQAGNNFKKEMSQAIDVKEWTRKYPFYSTGIAAATGFVLASGMTSHKFSKEIISKENLRPQQGFRAAFTVMLTNVAEDILKESVIPLVKEQILSLSNLANMKVREPIDSRENDILQGQIKMDAEGGNQGRGCYENQ